jgi:aldose 1-epimerase
MLSLTSSLAALQRSLPPRPFQQEALDAVVEKVLHDSAGISSPENRKSQWEYLLKDDVFSLAVGQFMSHRIFKLTGIPGYRRNCSYGG